MDENKSDYGEFKEFALKPLKQNIYFVIMALLSVAVITLAPFLGSTQDIVSNFPNTTAGWIVWITIRLIMAGLNIVIFYCFTEQGKLNIKDDEKYLKAKELLLTKQKNPKPPIDPKRWEKKQYTIKAALTALITLATGFGISQAIISYDYVALISYILTVVIGVTIGLIQMKQAEYYWTDEYYAYAIYKTRMNKEEPDVKDSEMLN